MKTADEVTRAVEQALSGLTVALRLKVLEDSIALYMRDGRDDVVQALRARLAQEEAKEPVVSLSVARITRDAPETLAEFAGFVSLEDSPGCTNADCRAYILGMETGILTARLDANPQEWNGTYHAENAAILERVANAKGYTVVFKPSGDMAWVFGTFTPLPPKPRLTVVPVNE